MIPLKILPCLYAVCRLEPSAEWPAPPASASLFSITQTADELSLVCLEEQAPPHARIEGCWRALQLQGPIPFTMTGVLASIAAPLAEARISIFAVSTFDTDYVLVKQADLPAVSKLLGISE